MKFDTSKNLTELEDDDWGEPEFDSYLVQTCYKLRYKPLDAFEIEDFRMLIDQDIGLRFLLPLAVKKLEEDPFAPGKRFKGELLCSLLRVDPQFYHDYPFYKKRVASLIDRARDGLKNLNQEEQETFEAAFNEALEEFPT